MDVRSSRPLRSKTIVSVVGARPNFMKLAPVARAFAAHRGARHIVVHTGQHHDPDMSGAFFDDLELAQPDHALEVGSGSHAQQTAAVMQRLEPILATLRPEWLLVYGDVNSTVAAALTAAKLGVRIAHVEAGLRSRDRAMPEEINRILTDHCAELLFAPSPDAVDNLVAEGIPASGIHFVGNVMIDSLCWALPKVRALRAATRLGMAEREYGVVTLHRPSNVDDPARLTTLVQDLSRISKRIPLVFPVHPRTRRRLEQFGVGANGNGALRLVDPMSYFHMLALVSGARIVITDSGGLQEETTYLGIPCLTVRDTTERPITCELGTNQLVPAAPGALMSAALGVIARPHPERPKIPRWDGRTAERIVDVVLGRASYTAHHSGADDAGLGPGLGRERAIALAAG